MDALLTPPSRSLPAIPGGPSGDARFGLWLLALDHRDNAEPENDKPAETAVRHLRAVAAA
ncbi:hypothetical protein EV646_114107 [Kribbella antiqua]|uniref:Uncharacterized protein n=1 Tax=Kribbella antiqua TaxID=2512217 RepID=A0A4R2ICK2_9ACTN|nr:hypothetical protein EV646_114107 [Kribbella antiqua]